MGNNAPAVVGHFDAMSKESGTAHALSALSALGQSTRLAIFRLLMRSEPEGLPAGAIAEALACTHNTLSSHLGILARSGLVQGARNGRFIVYRANVETMKCLIAYLANDCCAGHPELCNLQDSLRGPDCGCAPPDKVRKRRK